MAGWDWSDLDEHYRQGIVYVLITAAFYTCLTLILRKAQALPTRLTPITQMAWEGLSGAAVSSLLVWPSHEAS